MAIQIVRLGAKRTKGEARKRDRSFFAPLFPLERRKKGSPYPICGDVQTRCTSKLAKGLGHSFWYRKSARKGFAALFIWALFLVVSPIEGFSGDTIQQNTSYSILFGGDTSFGESYQKRGDHNIIATRGYEYPFERIKPLLMSADLVVANLETTITNVAESPYEGRKKYIHWNDLVKAPVNLSLHNIEVVSLANNHAMDYGTPGLQQTMQALSSHGIEYFGAGANIVAAREPWIRKIEVGDITVPLVVLAAYAYRPKYDKEYSFYAGEDRPGVFMLDKKDIRSEIQEVKKKCPSSFLVVFPHWGWNYQWRNESQVQFAHLMIDAGADLIIGHGAHMLQEVERYRGKWIIYSVGNLMFASKGRYQRLKAPPFSIPARLEFNVVDGLLTKSVRLYPIVSDNLQTQYQPRPVNFVEFNQVNWLMQEKSPNVDVFTQEVASGFDDIGFYFDISL